MTTIRPHAHDADAWDDEEDTPTFERVRKQSEKPQTPKSSRRQQDKEWGRAIGKLHKQRARVNKKP